MKTLLNRVLVTLLVLSLLLSAAPQLFGTLVLAADDGADEDYQDMKIAVLSDLHFKAGDGAVDTAFITMMEQFKTAIWGKPQWHGEMSATERSQAGRNMNQIGG